MYISTDTITRLNRFYGQLKYYRNLKRNKKISCMPIGRVGYVLYYSGRQLAQLSVDHSISSELMIK